MRKRLLVVASDMGLRMALARWLAPAGYAIELAEGPKKAREVLADGEVAAGIVKAERLDAALLAVARELRDAARGVIAVVDKIDDIGRLRRLGFWADAYLAQPLKKSDVVRDVHAVMQAMQEPKDLSAAIGTINFYGMTLDVSGRSLLDAAGCEVNLTRAEFDILAALLGRPGQVVSRDRLLDAVSGRSAGAYDRSIDNLVARLRRKIEPNVAKPRLILTVRGAGYKFSPCRGVGIASPPSLSTGPRRSILVLSLANLGDGPEYSNAVAAVPTMLAAELRHIVGAQVYCHLDDGHGALEIGRRLGVQYVVRASVRGSAGDICIVAQMTDVCSGLEVWADRFDGKLVENFGFESLASAQIARAIDLELVDVESSPQRAWRRPPGCSRPGDLRLRLSLSSSLGGKSRVGARLFRASFTYR